MNLGDRVDNLITMLNSSKNILEMSENDYHLKNSIKLIGMTLDELMMYKLRIKNSINKNMKNKKMYKEVEMICKNERIMEKYYKVEKFNNGDPYFTTSQETDVKKMISDGLGIEEIISSIRKW